MTRSIHRIARQASRSPAGGSTGAVLALAVFVALAALSCLVGCQEGYLVGQPTPTQPVDRTRSPAAIVEEATWVQPDVTLAGVRRILAAGLSRAQELDVRMNIAVVDAGGNLKGFLRMDGAWLGSIDIAIKKARTARLFDLATGRLGQLSQPGGSLYSIEHSNGGLITFPGGMPISDATGRVVGAVGVSGSTVENDKDVAVVAASALGK